MAEMGRRHYSQRLYGLENTAWRMTRDACCSSCLRHQMWHRIFQRELLQISLPALFSTVVLSFPHCLSLHTIETGQACDTLNTMSPNGHCASLCLHLAQQFSLFSLESQAHVRSVTLLRSPVVRRPSLMEEARLCGERRRTGTVGGPDLSNEAIGDSSLTGPAPWLHPQLLSDWNLTRNCGGKEPCWPESTLRAGAQNNTLLF